MADSKSCKHDESELDSAKANIKQVSVYGSLLGERRTKRGGGIKEQTHYSAYNIPPKNLSHKRNIHTTVLREAKSELMPQT